MLYLEDFLELIEHLPQELRDRFTDIRERDLQVHNSSEQLKEKVKHFFASAKKSKPDQRECELQKLLDDYRETEKYADDKVHIADQMQSIMTKLVQRLDTELERFKLELEADHAGITEELEKRSLELDSDTRFDDLINNHLNAPLTHNSSNSTAKVSSLNYNINQAKQPAGIKDRRRSEHKQHRHHPYHNNHTNGYHQQQGRGKLSNQEHDHPDNLARNNQRQLVGKSNGPCRTHNLTNTSNCHSSQSYSSSSAPASVAGDLNGTEHLSHFGNYNSLPLSNDLHSKSHTNKQQRSNLPPKQQQSNLGATLALGHQHHLNVSSQNGTANQNKISGKDMKNTDRIETIGQNPLAAAASQAIAATQQLQLGRRTPSLKASFAAINTGSLNPLDTLPGNKQDALSGGNRNALAPMTPDQQGLRYGHFGKTNGRPKAGPSPLFSSNNLSVTKSGRPTKRPRHHASHLYPDESPTSNSSDNSVFENSESVSSADFIETGTTFGSGSPASLDFATNNTSQSNTTLYHRDETKYCVCRQISYGEMVACDNVGCEIEWFHYDCVGITQPPKGKWFCPDCTRSRHLGTTAIKSSRHFKETSNV